MEPYGSKILSVLLYDQRLWRYRRKTETHIRSGIMFLAVSSELPNRNACNFGQLSMYPKRISDQSFMYFYQTVPKTQAFRCTKNWKICDFHTLDACIFGTTLQKCVKLGLVICLGYIDNWPKYEAFLFGGSKDTGIVSTVHICVLVLFHTGYLTVILNYSQSH